MMVFLDILSIQTFSKAADGHTSQISCEVIVEQQNWKIQCEGKAGILNFLG